jgi:hypothetical protein
VYLLFTVNQTGICSNGADLEVILAAYVPPTILFEAIKDAYEDAGHSLKKEIWEKTCAKVINDTELIKLFPLVDDEFDLQKFKLESIGPEVAQRAFVFALLDGPHSCKAVKDMRMIAEVLAKHDAIPKIVDDLRAKVLRTMLKPGEIDHANPDLAAP